MIKVSVKKLTSNNFKKFGHVISAKNNKNALLINNGWTKRLNKLSSYQSLEKNASMPIISIFRGYRRDFPIEVKMLECHPLASQAFIPLFGGDWLIELAPGMKKNQIFQKLNVLSHLNLKELIFSQGRGIIH